ncbi:MAG: hypothetical protein II888_03870 [Clostridia bacterium]|nr:hypothetical protein [Clostridia bacterium]
MSRMNSLPGSLTERKAFTLQEFSAAMSDQYKMTSPQIAYDLQKRLDTGALVRLGWNQYTVELSKPRYAPHYSDLADEIAGIIEGAYVGLDFQISELILLNEFMNHLIAHNTVFVFAENDFQNYVFDTLKQAYPGRVMLRPGVKQYYQYLQEDMIVILRLPTESPKGFDKLWHIRLEKLIVEFLTDKLIRRIVPEGEKETIIQGAFDTYLMDTNTMVRYAKRKGAESKFRQAMAAYEVTDL